MLAWCVILTAAGIFAVILAFNLNGSVRANPEPTHYVSPSGVPTTVLPTDRNMFVPIIVACAGVLAVLLSRRARIEVAGVSRPVLVAPAAVVQSASAPHEIDAARTKPPSRWVVGWGVVQAQRGPERAHREE